MRTPGEYREPTRIQFEGGAGGRSIPCIPRSPVARPALAEVSLESRYLCGVNNALATVFVTGRTFCYEERAFGPGQAGRRATHRRLPACQPLPVTLQQVDRSGTLLHVLGERGWRLRVSAGHAGLRRAPAWGDGREDGSEQSPLYLSLGQP